MRTCHYGYFHSADSAHAAALALVAPSRHSTIRESDDLWLLLVEEDCEDSSCTFEASTHVVQAVIEEGGGEYDGVERGL